MPIQKSEAQPWNTTKDYSQLDFEENDTIIVFNNFVRFRDKPSVIGRELGKLSAGDTIVFLEKTAEKYTLLDREYSWIKAKSRFGIGFVVEGFLASGTISFTNNQQLLYQFQKPENDGWEYEICFKILTTNNQIYLGNHDLSNRDFKITLHDSKGLTGIEHVLEIDYTAEACGEEGGSDFYTLDLSSNDPFHKLTTVSCIGDADIYHIDEELIFPDNPGGMSGKLIFNAEMGSRNDNDSIYKIVQKQKVFEWKGPSNTNVISPLHQP